MLHDHPLMFCLSSGSICKGHQGQVAHDSTHTAPQSIINKKPQKHLKDRHPHPDVYKMSISSNVTVGVFNVRSWGVVVTLQHSVQKGKCYLVHQWFIWFKLQVCNNYWFVTMFQLLLNTPSMVGCVCLCYCAGDSQRPLVCCSLVPLSLSWCLRIIFDSETNFVMVTSWNTDCSTHLWGDNFADKRSGCVCVTSYV